MVWTLIWRGCLRDIVWEIKLGRMDGELEGCVVIGLEVDMAGWQGLEDRVLPNQACQ